MSHLDVGIFWGRVSQGEGMTNVKALEPEDAWCWLENGKKDFVAGAEGIRGRKRGR